jgi:hypothetical protein
MAELIALQLRTWPEHGKFLEASFQGRDPQLQATRERLAELIWRLARTDPAAYAAGYRWTCEAVHEETFHFLRSGSYRRQTFASARQEVYDNPRIMGQYMRGVLFSQLFWPNHSRVMDSYIREFLPQQPEGHSLLEIGPGHGLFCALAAQDPRTGAIEAWDVSRTSLAQTRQHLARLGCPGRVRLVRRDACKPDRERPGTRPPFQGLVLSEVLEHVEPRPTWRPGPGSSLASRSMPPPPTTSISSAPPRRSRTWSGPRAWNWNPAGPSPPPATPRPRPGRSAAPSPASSSPAPGKRPEGRSPPVFWNTAENTVPRRDRTPLKQHRSRPSRIASTVLGATPRLRKPAQCTAGAANEASSGRSGTRQRL